MIITLEEHYFDPSWNEVADQPRHMPRPDTPLLRKLSDFGALRIRDMDEAGIDLQIISHGPPGTQGARDSSAVAWTRATNDFLHRAVAEHPTRLAGMASIPTSDPHAGAGELERAVTKLGFKGGMIHSLTEGPFLDDKRFWPIFERAQALDTPIYIHPADPHPAIINAYYRDYAKTHPMFIRAGWGFMVETGTQAMRLVLSGVFDAYPRLKLILGHLGETIPYQMSRIDEALSRDTPMKNFRQVFTEHFYVTTSGFFSDPALSCCIAEMGIDRVLFSVDWPFASNKAGVDWMQTSRLPAADKEKIFAKNAQQLFRL